MEGKTHPTPLLICPTSKVLVVTVHLRAVLQGDSHRLFRIYRALGGLFYSPLMNHIWLPGCSFESVKQPSWPARGVNCGVNEPARVKSDFYLYSSQNITKTSYARVPVHVQCTFTSRWSRRTRPCTRVTPPSCTARPPGTPSRTSTG